MVFTKKQMGTSNKPTRGAPTPAQSGGKAPQGKGGTPTPAQSGVPNRGSTLTNPGKKKKAGAKPGPGDYRNLFGPQSDAVDFPIDKTLKGNNARKGM